MFSLEKIVSLENGLLIVNSIDCVRDFHLIVSVDGFSRTLVLSLTIMKPVRILHSTLFNSSSTLSDCCHIRSNTVVPPDTVIPLFAIVEGNPGRVVGQVPICTQQLMQERFVVYILC